MELQLPRVVHQPFLVDREFQQVKWLLRNKSERSVFFCIDNLGTSFTVLRLDLGDDDKTESLSSPGKRPDFVSVRTIVHVGRGTEPPTLDSP